MKPQRIGETHSFHIRVAEAVGIEKALLLKEIYGWCHMNLAREKNVFDGFAFSYNPAKAFCEKFPYMNPKSVARWLKQLEKEEWICTANFNKMKYDRTKWYTIDFDRYDSCVKGEKYIAGSWYKNVTCISQNEKWTSQNEEIDFSKSGNDISQNEEPIPSPTISYTSPTSFFIKSDDEEIFIDPPKKPIEENLSADDVQTLKKDVRVFWREKADAYIAQLKKPEHQLYVIEPLQVRTGFSEPMIYRAAEIFATDQIAKDKFYEYNSFDQFKAHFYNWLPLNAKRLSQQWDNGTTKKHNGISESRRALVESLLDD